MHWETGRRGGGAGPRWKGAELAVDSVQEQTVESQRPTEWEGQDPGTHADPARAQTQGPQTPGLEVSLLSAILRPD